MARHVADRRAFTYADASLRNQIFSALQDAARAALRERAREHDLHLPETEREPTWPKSEAQHGLPWDSARLWTRGGHDGMYVLHGREEPGKMRSLNLADRSEEGIYQRHVPQWLHQNA